MDAHNRSSRYGRYDGGPDPLAPPVDLAEALDAIGEDVMAGYSPERAMQRVPAPRRPEPATGSTTWPAGSRERRRDLLQPAQARRHPAARSGSCSTRAVLEERKQLARDVDDGRRRPRLRARCSCENLPASTAAAVNELADYDWQCRQAREDYERIKDLLGRELLDQRFAGMKQALENATDEDRAAINEMLARPQRAARQAPAAARTPHEDFDEFMDKHGDFFPENPQNVDELIDALAQRAAAAQRMLQLHDRRSSATS